MQSAFHRPRTFLRGPLQGQTHRERMYGVLQLHERSQLFFGTHDETLPVAVRIHNPDCSRFKIDSGDPA
jgi:hypothetical protein